MSDAAIKTTVVGSYPIPAWLAAYPSEPNLRDALLVVIKTQELAGLDVLSDGELSRFDVNHPATNGMIEYFLRPMGGINPRVSRSHIEAYRRQTGMAFRARPPGVIEGDLHEGVLNLPAAYEQVRQLTSRPLKFTCTSPYMLAKTLIDLNYPDLRTRLLALADVLAAQLAAIDAPVIQIDEANLPGSPQDGPLAAEAINRMFAAVRGEKGFHLCFGNYGGQTIQKGFHRDLLPFYNALDCDHLILEFARRGYDELEVFRDLKPSIALGVGIVDIKDNQVESPDDLARRIEQAVNVLGPQRVRWVHPDCGFWMLPRPVADAKMRALVQGRELYVGRRA